MFLSVSYLRAHHTVLLFPNYDRPCMNLRRVRSRGPSAVSPSRPPSPAPHLPPQPGAQAERLGAGQTGCRGGRLPRGTLATLYREPHSEHSRRWDHSGRRASWEWDKGMAPAWAPTFPAPNAPPVLSVKVVGQYVLLFSQRFLKRGRKETKLCRGPCSQQAPSAQAKLVATAPAT